MNPALISALIDVHARASLVGHGGRGAIYDDACRRLGMSRATLLRKIKEVVVRPERKRRADAGDIALSREEAVILSSVLMDSLRKNRKRLQPIGEAVALLRANGEIRAERIDPATGEIIPLSDSTIARALRSYSLHPEQLLRPAPHTELRSLHPNHVWQIDASLCVLYYLKARTAREAGLQIMEARKFYKNKPRNLQRIANDRVWSYEITDHWSGAIFVFYVLGAESAANLAESFIRCTQQRGQDPFYGVCFNLMMDMGCANTSGAFKNLARRLGVRLMPHAPGNARATGQVENARNIIERSFESGLRLKPVADLDELNAAAQRWARWYNATKTHSRHGKTRFEAWMEIRPEQLRTVDGDLARRLLTHTPERRKVSGTLTVAFDGAEYDVKTVPNVQVGEWLDVSWNPYRPGTAVIVDTDAEGNETLRDVPTVARGEGGFRDDAPVIGEAYARVADTAADTHRKLVERVAMEADTDEAAAARRKAGGVSFGGRIDPDKLRDGAQVPTYLPRVGTPIDTAAIVSDAPPAILNHFEAASEMLRRGIELTVERNADIAAWYPDGVPEDQLDALAARLTARAGLRVVGGKGA
jgi:transposase InsO family protein